MRAWLQGLLREHLAGAVLLLLCLPFSVISVVALLWTSSHEVLWHGGWVFRQCGIDGTAAGRDCVAGYELALGNSGSGEEELGIEWPVDVRDWTFDHRVLDLDGASDRANDPEVQCARDADAMYCTVARFAPGTLLLLRLRCLQCGHAALDRIESTVPVVLSTATVHQGDPRATVLFRRLGVLLRLL